MEQGKNWRRGLKNGLWAGFCFTILSGFAVFALPSGAIKWDIREGQSVKFLLNPSGCECGLTEAEILEIFQQAMARWNDVQDSFFLFEDWADVSPASLSPQERKIYEELQRTDPTFRRSSPNLKKEDGLNVIGFSNDLPDFAVGGALNRFSEEGFIKESDVVLRQGLDYKKQSLAFVMTHELGHVLGLAHDQADTAAVMSYGRNRDSSSLGADDITGAVFLYPKAGVGLPEADWGCTTILPIDHDSSFFDKALLGFLFFVALMILALSLAKRYEKQKNRNLGFPLFWKRFFQGGLLGGLVLVLAVACAESLEESSEPVPTVNRIDFRQGNFSQNSFDPPESAPIISGNTISFYCPF